jgi:hypothetical protein
MLGVYGERVNTMRDLLQSTSAEEVNQQLVVDFWFRMDAISRTFEEVAREWGLPTVLGQMCSYPADWLDDGWHAYATGDGTAT